MSLTLRRAAFPILAAAMAAAPAAAQTPPPAEQLVQRYVEAIGGRDAVLGHRTSRTRGTIDVPAAGIQGRLEVVAGAPNRTASVVDLPGLGVMRSGFDGQVWWAADPIMGARLLQGAELDMVRDQANVLLAVRDPSVVREMRTVERTEIGGEPCWKVRMVLASGREMYDCYHVETGLVVGQVATQTSPMGAMEVTTRIGDYREVQGVRIPFRMVQEMMGMEQIITVTSVEFDAVADAEFDPPAEIHALMGH
jgi:hypothetical protein